MAKTKISEFSSTPANNTDIDSINIAEGCAPSGINDAIRELMAQLKDFQTGAAGDSFNGPVGTSTAAAGAFTTLTTSSTVTHNGGTANGVAYLNGSKVLTTGSALVFDGSNLGLGVTPSAWRSTDKAMQIGAQGSIAITSTHRYQFGVNTYTDSAGTNTYIGTGNATRYEQFNGEHQWRTAPSGTAGNAISFRQDMTLDASGGLLVGTTSNAEGARLNVQGGYVFLKESGGGDVYLRSAFGGSNPAIQVVSNSPLLFLTNNTERARIDSSGNLLVGVSSGSQHIFSKNTGNGAGTTSIFEVQNAGQDIVASFMSGTFYGSSNSAGTSLRIGRSNTTSRSINAAGTINASGADYAEYMTKAGDFTIAKGDVIGINAAGRLTNVFADAVSFCVKSTDPSYVGNDKWGCDFENDPEGLETARQLVDRIAFAGQVPVNVMGATSGQYIVPVSDNGAIKGIAKNESDMTLADYMKSVGKVIAVQDDGRAFIIVKVA
jgi:hypothetical protein